MPGPDFPDWSQQTVAGIRFAGATPLSSGGVQKNLDIAVTTFERAVLVHTPNDSSGVWTIQVIGLTTGRVSSYVTGIGADQWIVAYVNPAFDPTWEVQVTNAGATNLYCECFVDTTLPLVRVANVAGQAIPATFDPLGQASSAASVPVVIASDQVVPVTVSPGSQGRAQFAITDGTTDWLVGWAFLRAGAPGQSIVLTFDPGIVPAVLNAGVSWFMKMTLSDIAGVNAYDTNVLVDYLAGAATAVSQVAEGQAGATAGTSTFAGTIAGGSKIVRVRADVTMRG